MASRPQLESHSSDGSSVTLTPSSVPTPPTPESVAEAANSDPSSSSRKPNPAVSVSTSSASPASGSRSLPKKKAARRSPRPATAPTGEGSSREALLPAHSPSTLRIVELPPTNDDDHSSRPSTAGGASTSGNPEPPIVGEMLDPVTRRSTRAQSRFGAIPDLRRELEETVIDGVAVPSGSSSSSQLGVTSPPIRPDPVSARQPGPDWAIPATANTNSPTHPIDFEPRDWQNFMRAYADGLWDPFKIPHPPQKSPAPPATRPPPSNASSSLRRASTATSSFAPPQDGPVFPLISPAIRPPSGPPTPSIAQRRGAEAPDLRSPPNVKLVAPTPPAKGAAAFPLKLPQFPGRPTFRSTGSDPIPNTDEEPEEFPPAPSVDSITAAATVRWAGAGVDVAPLALPSPEYELTDPFRRMNQDGAPRTPRSPGPRPVDARSYRSPRRDHRSPQAVRSGIPSMVKSGYESDPPSHTRTYGSRPMTPSLEMIKGSPVSSPGEKPESEAELGASHTDGHIMSPGVQQERSVKSGGDYFHRPSSLNTGTTRTPGGTLVAYMAFPGLQSVPGASSVPAHAANNPNNDYFGNVKDLSSPEIKEAPEAERPSSSSGLLNSGMAPRTPGGRYQTIEAQLLPGMVQDLSSMMPDGASDLIYNDPQSKQEAAYVLAAAGALNPAQGAASHSGVFEAWYATAGYLIPPMPPNETERRKALYRYNILDSPKDPNFDRIVHLAKLVFNTKGVVISFIADSRQWHKAYVGVDMSEADRTISMCSHTILQRTSEPVIVPDASKDWRFANNPCVTGGPKVRFYAGAPLRTPDGYNIGTLCIFDSEPKPETSPRTRHALKEFATIVMREMELWKDKIQLGIRDRIQNSMEQFTRECLETDVSEDPKKAALDMAKVYQKAATLVRNTLDVSGCVIMDLSHFEAVDTVDASGKKTTLYIGNAYDGSPTTGSPPIHASAIQRKTEFGPIAPLPVHAVDEDEDESNPARDEPISSEDHAVLSKFLATCPEGRIYERLPKCFKRFVPSNLQYTMMVPVFDVDKRPIFMLCAYTRKGIMHVMEGYELQYLRAVGVIILSVVLKHRMTVANTAKTNFISKYQ
ncbi:His Kinase A domain containing protein [Tulasnella sp. 408]|nr:His Kinase A domain containing protein [Tulasnella sp. 408]